MPRSNAKKSTRETKRTQKAELRRDEIMSAAIDVFHRDGFRGASLEDVADEVGISKSLIYYHFKNKMELLNHILCQMLKQVQTFLHLIVADTEIYHTSFPYHQLH